MESFYFWPLLGMMWAFGWMFLSMWGSHAKSQRRDARLRMQHEERMKAMEQGVPLPEFPELDDGSDRDSSYSSRSSDARSSLGAAAIVGMLGLGLSLVFNPFILPGHDDLQTLWPFGLLGVFLGIGLVLNYYLTRPSS